MKPMLARTVGPKYDRYPCFVQPKLNGVRALYQNTLAGGMEVDLGSGLFQSRDEKFWKPVVLKHLHDELSSLELGDLILDGELYKHGWRLQDINGAVAVNRLQPREDTGEIEFHVFDVVDLNHRFSDRFLDLHNSLLQADLPHIIPVPTAFVWSWPEAQQHFYNYTAEGYEGVMLRPDGKYELGEHIGRNGTLTDWRSRSLWKHKQWEDGEFVCVGVTEGEGKAEIGVGALTLKVSNGATFGVGTGLTDQDRIEFSQRPPVGRLVKVRYLTLTADGIPFNPSFLAVL